MPVTLPTMMPRILTSAPLASEPPALPSTAEIFVGPPITPDDLPKITSSTRAVTRMVMRPRLAYCARVISTRFFWLAMVTPRSGSRRFRPTSPAS